MYVDTFKRGPKKLQMLQDDISNKGQHIWSLKRFFLIFMQKKGTARVKGN